MSDNRGHGSEIWCDGLQTLYWWVEAIDIPLVGINHAIERTKRGSRSYKASEIGVNPSGIDLHT